MTKEQIRKRILEAFKQPDGTPYEICLIAAMNEVADIVAEEVLKDKKNAS